MDEHAELCLVPSLYPPVTITRYFRRLELFLILENGIQRLSCCGTACSSERRASAQPPQRLSPG